MDRIAVITSNYMPNPDANGICVYNIINELKKTADELVCICNQQESEKQHELLNDVKILRISPAKHMRAIRRYQEESSWKNRLKMSATLTARRAKNLLNIRRYPRTEIRREKAIVSLLEQLPEFDLVIAAFRPFDGIGAAIEYKKRHPKCQICGYFLDSVMDFSPQGISHKIYRKIAAGNERHYLEKLDIILKPENDKKYYKDCGLDKDIDYVKFPVFVKSESTECYKFGKNELSLVFVGTLNSSFRSPEYLLDIIQRLRKDGYNIKFHFFGTYDNSRELNGWQKKYKDFFSYHGSISFQLSRTVLASADILVNISNKDLEMVPSKVYELMAQGKPILHISSNRNDVCEKCFGSYPLVCSLNSVEGNMDNNIRKLKNFFDTQIKKEIDYRQVYLENYKATPEYVCEVILKKCKSITSPQAEGHGS